MKTNHLNWLAVVFLTISGCSESTSPNLGPQTHLLYSNSFENPNDGVGWNLSGLVSFYYDSSKPSGNQCLRVRGGNVSPQAQMVLDSLDESSEIVFRFDAKCVQYAGGRVLLIAQVPSYPDPEAGFIIYDTTWGTYVDTAEYPSGYNLRIWIDGNGTLGSPILVDNIEVSKIQY